MLVFGAIGPIIRRKTPEGFVLTEWTRQRYGIVAMLYLSFMTLVTLFLYMVAELSAVSQVVTLLTSLNGLPVIIVQVVVTAIYTCELCLCYFLTNVFPYTLALCGFIGLLVIGLLVIPHPALPSPT
jgi:Na+/proline symporter